MQTSSKQFLHHTHVVVMQLALVGRFICQCQTCLRCAACKMTCSSAAHRLTQQIMLYSSQRTMYSSRRTNVSIGATTFSSHWRSSEVTLLDRVLMNSLPMLTKLLVMLQMVWTCVKNREWRLAMGLRCRWGDELVKVC